MSDDAVENNTQYYVRVKGRVAGPFSTAQLRSLRSRGQISRATEISTDRESWGTVATIEHLFSTTTAKKTRLTPVEVEEEPVPATPPSKTMAAAWYYAAGDEQAGPVTLLELRGMISGGQLHSDDLVWKDGMADWEPISNVRELNLLTRSSNMPQTVGNFCYACGTPTDVRAEVCPKCGVRQHISTKEPKSRVLAIVLALLVGGIGIHRFYLNQPIIGLCYMLFFWTFIPAVIAFVDAIVLICMSDEKFRARYSS